MTFGKAFWFFRHCVVPSAVRGHEGPCTPVWISGPTRFRRSSTGFFRNVKTVFGVMLYKYGPEFHGIAEGGKVNTTEGRYDL